MTQYSIKESDSLAKTTKDIAILQHAHKQPFLCGTFGTIHYEIHLDMKLNYTIGRIFQEMSLSELETLHQLCEHERTHVLQSLALAVLKIPYA